MNTMRILRKLLNIRVIVIIGIVVMAILFSHTLQKKKNAATSTESARDGGKSNVASTSPSKESETFDAAPIEDIVFDETNDVDVDVDDVKEEDSKSRQYKSDLRV